MTITTELPPTDTDDDIESLARSVGVIRDRVGGDWRHDALCRDPRIDRSVFSPADHAAPTRAARDARWFCDRCPVKPDCLEWALDQRPVEDHGIAGGTSPTERRRIRAERRALDA